MLRGDDVPTERSAIDWLIALEEQPDDQQLRTAHHAWLASSGNNRADWQEVQLTWATIGQVPYTAQSTEPARGFARRALHPTRAARRIAGALTALAAAIVLFLAMPGLLIWLEADYSTGIGETRVVALADGSTVTLAADSAVTAELGEKDRRVRLLKGQAFFEVAANPAKPFVVSARQTETTVYGTAFDVQQIGSSVAVAVDHGSVGVQWSEDGTTHSSERLGAGDWVEFTDTGELDGGQIPADAVGAWRNGSLVVQDRPVADVVAALQRSFHGQIVVTDGSLMRDHVTGVYALANPEQALRAAVHIHGGRVRQITPWILLVDRP